MRGLIAMAMLAAVACMSPTPAEAGTANFTLRDINGRYIRLSNYRKKLVYLSFWATWCKPCLKELKHLRKFYEKYKSKGFIVIAISLDGPETRSRVKATAQRYKMHFPVAVDADNSVTKLYIPRRALPYSVLIKKGRVIKKRAAFQISDLPLIEKEIVDALK